MITQETVPEACASALSGMRERYLTIGGKPLCLCQWGEANAPAIILVHGFLQQGASWHEVATSLAENGFGVTAPDLRGHGRSAKVGRGGIHSTLNFLIDLDRTLDSLSTVAVILAGHSFGAILSAITARVRSDRVAGLVLIEPVLPVRHGEKGIAAVIKDALKGFVDPPNHPLFPDLETAARWLREVNPGISNAMALQLAERATEPCGAGVRWSWDPSLRSARYAQFGSRRDYLHLLQEIDVPVTIIYGDHSFEHDETDRAIHRNAIPHCREVVLSGGHNLYFEAPTEIQRYITELARLALPEADFLTDKEAL